MTPITKTQSWDDMTRDAIRDVVCHIAERTGWLDTPHIMKDMAERVEQVVFELLDYYEAEKNE